MVSKLIINCQAFRAEGESLNILNGKTISLSEAARIKIVDLCYADSSYDLISNVSGTKVFRKVDNGKYHCVVYGHLEERDENDRRIPFCSYAEYSGNINEVFEKIHEDLKTNNYSTIIEYAPVATYNKKKNNSKLYLGIAIGVTVLLAAYLIYNSFSEPTNEINNGTEQTK